MRAQIPPLACLAVLFAGPHPAYAQDSRTPSAAELIDLAPRLSLEAEGCTTFTVKGAIQAPGMALRFIVRGQKPDRLAFAIVDPADRTPLVVCIGRKTAFYDPVTMKVFMRESGSAYTFTFKAEKEQAAQEYNIRMGFDFKNPPEGESRMSADIDLHSIMALISHSTKVRALDEGCFAVEGLTRNEGRILACVSPSRKEGPYSRLELRVGDPPDDFAVVALDSIQVDQPLPRSCFEFPEKELLDSDLQIVKAKGNGVSDFMLTMALVYRTAMARVVLKGAGKPELKKTIERFCKHELDWPKLAEMDRKAALTLRKIFKRTLDPPARRRRSF